MSNEAGEHLMKNKYSTVLEFWIMLLTVLLTAYAFLYPFPLVDRQPSVLFPLKAQVFPHGDGWQNVGGPVFILQGSK